MTGYTEIDIQCNKIRDMLADPKYKNHTDIENALGLKRAAYYRRSESVDKRTSRQNSLESDNLTRITNALENVSSITYEISNNKKEKARDRIAASQMYLTTEIRIYQNSVHGKLHSFPKIFDIKPKSLNLECSDFEIGDKFDK
jgi:hypothetical protein